jgi:hypothetical protein
LDPENDFYFRHSSQKISVALVLFAGNNQNSKDPSQLEKCMLSRPIPLVFAFVLSMIGGIVSANQVREYKSGVIWPEPKVIDAGPVGGPPSDAIVLFDGKDLSKWKNGNNWEIKDGVATAKKSEIETKEGFGSCQLHVEFATPEKIEGSGQGRGNSGIYLMGKYEVQILDSYNNKTYFDGQCASIYKQTPPMVNASRKPGEWQSYDIIFDAPQFAEDGKVTKPGYVTVLHNGVLVQNHFELHGGTFYDRPAAYTKHPDKLPLHIQFHGNPVKFRNIWIREITPIVGKKPEPKGKEK